MKKKPPSAAIVREVMAELGRRGGEARAQKQSKKALSEIGKLGAAARWRKKGEKC